MRKTLIAMSLSLLAAAAAGIATNAAAQPEPAQRAQPLPPARQMPPMARGRGAPQAAERRGRMCDNAEALAAGRLASLEVRLKLTPAQGPLFNRWREVRLAAARKRAQACAAMPEGRGANPARPGAAERLARQETRLQDRLADIRAERPALQALASALSEDQRQILDRAEMGGGRPMMRGRRMGMMQRGGPRGPMMGNGPGLMGPMGRGTGGDMPLPRLQNPPPPAQ